MNATLLIALALGQTEFTGKVVSVHDGDTARVEKQDGTVVNVRFIISDAPEIDQPHGVESRDFVKGRIDGKNVTVKDHGLDDFGRTLGEIIIDGKSVNVESIEKGHAWWFYHYHPDHGDAAKAEMTARSGKLGLFAADAPLYPRAWRRGARLGQGDSGGGPGGGGGQTGGVEAGVFIMAVLPNPVGQDQGNETVTLGNSSDEDVNVATWQLVDDDGGAFSLTGTIPTGGTLTVKLTASLQLGNNGDEVSLKNGDGDVVHTLEYTSAQNGRFVLAE